MWCEFDDGFELVLLMLPFYTNRGVKRVSDVLSEQSGEDGEWSDRVSA